MLSIDIGTFLSVVWFLLCCHGLGNLMFKMCKIHKKFEIVKGKENVCFANLLLELCDLGDQGMITWTEEWPDLAKMTEILLNVLN